MFVYTRVFCTNKIISRFKEIVVYNDKYKIWVRKQYLYLNLRNWILNFIASCSKNNYSDLCSSISELQQEIKRDLKSAML